jgi:hypothetical protein
LPTGSAARRPIFSSPARPFAVGTRSRRPFAPFPFGPFRGRRKRGRPSPRRWIELFAACCHAITVAYSVNIRDVPCSWPRARTQGGRPHPHFLSPCPALAASAGGPRNGRDYRKATRCVIETVGTPPADRPARFGRRRRRRAEGARGRHALARPLRSKGAKAINESLADAVFCRANQAPTTVLSAVSTWFALPTKASCFAAGCCWQISYCAAAARAPTARPS